MIALRQLLGLAASGLEGYYLYWGLEQPYLVNQNANRSICGSRRSRDASRDNSEELFNLFLVFSGILLFNGVHTDAVDYTIYAFLQIRIP